MTHETRRASQATLTKQAERRAQRDEFHRNKHDHSWYFETYLRSDEWRALRDHALMLARHKCRVCGASENLNVHHDVYPKSMKRTRVEDLRVLCRTCHATAHGKTT